MVFPGARGGQARRTGEEIMQRGIFPQLLLFHVVEFDIAVAEC